MTFMFMAMFKHGFSLMFVLVCIYTPWGQHHCSIFINKQGFYN